MNFLFTAAPYVWNFLGWCAVVAFFWASTVYIVESIRKDER